jgi:hypothetical protein
MSAPVRIRSRTWGENCIKFLNLYLGKVKKKILERNGKGESTEVKVVLSE